MEPPKATIQAENLVFWGKYLLNPPNEAFIKFSGEAFKSHNSFRIKILRSCIHTVKTFAENKV